jgi:hypothetical protein
LPNFLQRLTPDDVPVRSTNLFQNTVSAPVTFCFAYRFLPMLIVDVKAVVESSFADIAGHQPPNELFEFQLTSAVSPQMSRAQLFLASFLSFR